MSENTINAVLRRLGYGQDELTAHGFRSLASTRLNEMEWRPDPIERQLAHQDADVRAVYNLAAYIEARRTARGARKRDAPRRRQGARADDSARASVPSADVPHDETRKDDRGRAEIEV